MVNSFGETHRRIGEEGRSSFHVPLHVFDIRRRPITCRQTRMRVYLEGDPGQSERDIFENADVRFVVRQRRQMKTRRLVKDERIYYIYYGYICTAGPRIKDYFINARVIILWVVTTCVCGRLC